MPREEQKQPGAHPLDRYTVPPQQESGGGEQSPYYKSQAPTISLPKGGGALKGIDEKFNVNAVNGTSGLQVAFPFTPGRGGFTPSLSLSYNSGSGNSEFGLGWSMSLPSIQRKTDKKLPEYNDAAESDVFLLAGAEDLVPKRDENGAPVEQTSGSYFIKEYIPRIEGLYARIEFIRKTNTPHSWWRVTTKDNITTWYGLTAAARIADPAAPSRIFKWLPEVVVDHKGNVQQYTYMPEDSNNVPLSAHETNRLNALAAYTNTYLKRVAYCNMYPIFIEGNVYEPPLPSTADPIFMMEAVLDYGDHPGAEPTYDPGVYWPCRRDPFSDFHACFEIRTYRKCRRVLMFHRFRELSLDGEMSPVIVRSLDISYQHDAAASDVEADYITAITQTGYYYNGITLVRKSLPAMTMQYQPLQWNNEVRFLSPEDAANAPQGLTGAYQWIDLYGTGLPGILSEQASAWWYKENLGDGHFTQAVSIAPKPSFGGLGGAMQWQDLDADGSRQLVTYDAATPGYFEATDPDLLFSEGSSGQQPLGWQPFRAFDKNINVDWSSPYTKMLDLDGDGRPDLLVADDRVWSWYRNGGREGYDEGGTASVCHDEEYGPRLLLNDALQVIFLADMNGDGLTDLVRIRNGEVVYWPNMGFGRFGAKVTMDNAPVFDLPDQFNPARIYLSDISGTGAADIIYCKQGRCTAWINRCGNSWSDGQTIAPFPSDGSDTVDGQPYDRLSVLDFLGNGTGCLVWSSSQPQYADAPLRYIDLMGGIKPYLMNSYNNGIGKTVSVTYKSSTRYYLEDRAAGKPWATRLPFPVHCVAQITTADTVSETSYTQLFSYHHGYYDHAEREFRGFGRVDTLDTDTAQAPVTELDQDPVLTRTWYHTGAWLPAVAGEGKEQSLIAHYAAEYFDIAPALPASAALVFPDGLSARELREACRAFKGLPLRQEVYAQDGSPLEDKPYTVTSFAYRVQLLQHIPATPDSSTTSGWEPPHGVFYAYQEQKLTLSCERAVSDPRVGHELTLEIDEYGNVLQAAQVVYPRADIPAGLPATVVAEQEKMHIVYQSATFSNDISTNIFYRTRMPVEAATCELYIPASAYPGGLWTVGSLLGILPVSRVDYTTPMTGSSPLLRTLSRQRTLYLGDDAGTPLTKGVIQARGLVYEQYTLAFTDPVTGQYGGRVTTAMLEEGAYVELDGDDAYWLPSGRVQYGVPGTDFYSPMSYRDPWGNVTYLNYWNNFYGEYYYLVLQSVTDPAGNTSSAFAYDWRLLQPTAISDINGNASAVAYDALGMLAAVALEPGGEQLLSLDMEDYASQEAFWEDPDAYAAVLLGDTTFRCVYDLSASPVAVAMIARERHILDPANTNSSLVRITYTDGMGRIAMHKSRAANDPLTGDPRWTGSGKTVYNNKGNVVLQYEPYFSNTHAYDPTGQAEASGVSPRIHYDPLGRARRTDMPDGTFSKTVWTSWMQAVYDGNDTVLDSDWYTAYSTGSAEEQDAAAKAAAHYNTPTVLHLDTLARPFYTVQFFTAPVSISGSGDIESYEVLDIQGNRRAVKDGRGLTPLTYAYNMLKAPLSQLSIDGGQQYMLPDAAGNPLYNWDADNRKFHFGYDVLRRPVLQEVTVSSTIKVLERMYYGEGVTPLANLRGQLYQHRDGAGLVTVSAYDFKGNPLSANRKYTADGTQHPDWTTPGAVSMESGGGYTTATTYDALNRPVKVTAPDSSKTLYGYEASGMLFSLRTEDVGTLDTDIVDGIWYDAKGQREKVQYENGATTTYEYDPGNFRVTRIRTVRASDSKVLQDLHYWYDPVGNITLQEDGALQTVYFANSVAGPENDYTYDSLYRLIQAGGRELAGNNGAVTSNDSARSGKNNIPYPNNTTVPLTNAAAMRRYIQYYTYDNVGNMLSMQHTNTSGSGNWTRNYTISGSSNRLTGSSIGSNGSSTDSYTYDNRGNLVAGMNHLNSGGTSMNYNAANRLESVVITSTITAYYQYDGSGQRVRKTLVNTAASTTEVRKYLGDWEVYGRTVGSTLVLERQTLHLSDDRGRVALIDTPTVDTLGTGEVQLLRYQYSNHLGTATLELDDDASVIDYEEYYPFGATSFQSGRSLAEVSLKRYRYTGKERDEETGLYYHGARYYAPWIARWTSVDPLESKYTPWSSYNYCEDNPVRLVDPSGMGSEDKVPAHWVKAGSRDDVFSEDGTNRYGYNEGYVDVKGDGRYKKYTAEQYWAEFGGNDDYRPAFYQNNPNPGKATAFAPKQKTKVADPLPAPVQQPISSPQPVATTNGEDGSVLDTVVDVAIGLTPFVGSGRDLYEGIKTGSVLLTAMGAGGLLLDFSTFGLASAFKGGIKATLLMFAKKGLENAAEAEAKNVVVDAAKGGTNALVKTGTQFSKHSLERLAQRGVTQDMAELAISKGQKFYDPLNKSINYVLPNGFGSGKSLLVGTNPLTGEVTTVIRSSKNLINSRFVPIK